MMDYWFCLDRDYEMVQSTNDPNTLAVFLGHSHYHVEGLLTLAMVFAHTGIQLLATRGYRAISILSSNHLSHYRPE